MSIDSVTEILAEHADHLNSGKRIETLQYWEHLPERSEELVPLLELAAQLKQVLTPVQAQPAFRARLHDGLMLAAHHQATHRMLVEQREEPPSQWGWLIGAAAIGSAAGLIAFVLRSRAQAGRTAGQAECVEARVEGSG